MAAKDDYLLDQLVELGYVTQAHVDDLRADAKSTGAGVVDLLLERKLITPPAVTTAKAAHFGVEMVNLGEMRLADEVISAIPRHVAKRYRVVPVHRHANHIAVALSDPSDLDTVDSLHHLLKAEIELRVASEADIDAALSKYYGAGDDSVTKMIQDITEGEVEIGGHAAAGEADDGATVDADALPLPLPAYVGDIRVANGKITLYKNVR